MSSVQRAGLSLSEILANCPVTEVGVDKLFTCPHRGISSLPPTCILWKRKVSSQGMTVAQVPGGSAKFYFLLFIISFRASSLGLLCGKDNEKFAGFMFIMLKMPLFERNSPYPISFNGKLPPGKGPSL